MICKECGTKLTPEQTTCPNCGALQQQAVPKKRKKPVDSPAVSQQDQPQSSKEQVRARPPAAGGSCAGNAGSRCMVAFHADETSRRKRPESRNSRH